MDLIVSLVKRLGTHATTVRIVEELKREGYHVEEDIVSVLTHARRVGFLKRMHDGRWTIGAEDL